MSVGFQSPLLLTDLSARVTPESSVAVAGAQSIADQKPQENSLDNRIQTVAIPQVESKRSIPEVALQTMVISAVPVSATAKENERTQSVTTKVYFEDKGVFRTEHWNPVVDSSKLIPLSDGDDLLKAARDLLTIDINANHPKLAFIVDPYFEPKIAEYVYKCGSYSKFKITDIQKLVDEKDIIVLKCHICSRYSWKGHSPDKRFIDLKLPIAELVKLVQALSDSGWPLPYPRECTYKEVNPYADFMLAAKKKGYNKLDEYDAEAYWLFKSSFDDSVHSYWIIWRKEVFDFREEDRQNQSVSVAVESKVESKRADSKNELLPTHPKKMKDRLLSTVSFEEKGEFRTIEKWNPFVYGHLLSHPPSKDPLIKMAAEKINLVLDTDKPLTSFMLVPYLNPKIAEIFYHYESCSIRIHNVLTTEKGMVFLLVYFSASSNPALSDLRIPVRFPIAELVKLMQLSYEKKIYRSDNIYKSFMENADKQGYSRVDEYDRAALKQFTAVFKPNQPQTTVWREATLRRRAAFNNRQLTKAESKGDKKGQSSESLEITKAVPKLESKGAQRAVVAVVDQSATRVAAPYSPQVVSTSIGPAAVASSRVSPVPAEQSQSYWWIPGVIKRMFG